ncbi:UNVERIFIED_CONTAM: hypothetical protein FKN15_055776 [Acipenser sinensis]
MGKKSRQRQRHKQQQQQLPPQLEDPASLFPFCSWCGREDHRWRSCPDGPPADWCGRCEVDGHSWAGCPHNLDQEQLQTPSSAATPPLPTSPPSPPSQEIWDWLMHPEADLFHDLPIAINTLWRRDGGRWEKWEAKHHPASFAELALMVVNYLAVDMGDALFKVELPSREPEREEPLPSREPEVEELLSREPEGVELLSREPEGVELLSLEPEGVELLSREPEGVELPSQEPEGVELLSREPEGVELLSREPEGVELLSREPEGVELLSREPEGVEPVTREQEGEEPWTREPEGEKAEVPQQPLHMLLRGAQGRRTRLQRQKVPARVQRPLEWPQPPTPMPECLIPLLLEELELPLPEWPTSPSVVPDGPSVVPEGLPAVLNCPPPFHNPCMACKAKLPHEDKHYLCARCLGVQHATLALKRDVACSICAAFQPQVRENRLERATRASSASSVAGPSAALGAPEPLLHELSQDPQLDIQTPRPPRSCSPSPQERRVKNLKQARDIMDLKAQSAQVLELLLKQAHAAPAAVPAPILPQLPYPLSPRGDQG